MCYTLQAFYKVLLAVCLTLTAGGNDDNFSFLFPPKFNKTLQKVAVENGKNLTFLESYFPLIQGQFFVKYSIFNKSPSIYQRTRKNKKFTVFLKKGAKKSLIKTTTDLKGVRAKRRAHNIKFFIFPHKHISFPIGNKKIRVKISPTYGFTSTRILIQKYSIFWV